MLEENKKLCIRIFVSCESYLYLAMHFNKDIFFGNYTGAVAVLTNTKYPINSWQVDFERQRTTGSHFLLKDAVSEKVINFF